MANKRIKDLVSEVTVPSTDSFLVVDSNTTGTSKISIANFNTATTPTLADVIASGNVIPSNTTIVLTEPSLLPSDDWYTLIKTGNNGELFIDTMNPVFPEAEQLVSRLEMNPEETAIKLQSWEQGVLKGSFNVYRWGIIYDNFEPDAVIQFGNLFLPKLSTTSGTMVLKVNGLSADENGEVLINFNSTIPTQTGEKWIDNKNVYKVIKTTVGNATPTLTISLNLTNQTETFIKASGMVKIGSDFKPLKINEILDNGGGLVDVNVEIDGVTNIGITDNIHLILEFTYLV